MADRMGPLDAFFVLAEGDAVNHMHVGGFATVRGAAPTHAAMLAHVAGRLPLIPRYRQVMRTVPLHTARPVWVDAQEFDVADHVRRVVLPTPSRADLRGFLEGVISERLDRSRPLWELWVVDGLGPDEWAVAWKLHHCMIDGVSGTELLTVLFDASAEPAPTVEDRWAPRPVPGAPELLRDALVDLTRASIVQGPGVAVGLARLARDAVRLGARLAGSDRGTPLNGPVGPLRSYDWTTVRFADVQQVRAALGGTVNDVVLTAVLAGYRDWLVSHDQPVVDRTLKVLVPVALRERDARGQPVGDGTMMNRTTGLLADLPLGIADPAERLAAVRARLDQLKASGEGEVMHAVGELGGLAPAIVLAVGLRAAAVLPQRAVGAMVTNVRGPDQVLHLLGGRIEHIWSYAPLALRARTSVGVYSYDGVLHVGVTGDRESVPDVDVIATGIRQGVADLVSAASRAGAAPSC